MLSIPSHVRVYVCTIATDMRKSFDGLQALVLQVFKSDPLDGHLFLFRNRRGDRVKILWWDRDGLAMFYKRLESGTYQLPEPDGGSQAVEIDSTDLALLLTGVDIKSAKRRKRYSRIAG
jgi:transposase